MLTHDSFQSNINNLRIVLNCFYIYLIINACQYAKKVIFQYPYSVSIIYISIRSIISAFCIFLYSILIIYSLWSKRIVILSISLLLLTIFLIIRLISDIYGYSFGYFEYSLYPPFELIKTNLIKININKQKQIIEEIIDFNIELIRNIIGILLTIFIIIRMKRIKWERKQIELRALRIDVRRSMTM